MSLRSFSTLKNLARNVRDLDKILINQGIMLSRDYKGKSLLDLREAEFRIFSQWGEDGIIQYLTQNIDIEHKTFIEFGVETFVESNCRFLMLKDFWKGFVIDGSPKNINEIKNSEIHWRYNLTAVDSFISKDNIADLLGNAPFDGIGILSVDIDGVDYYILDSLKHLRPSIIIVEYNGLFGKEAAVSVPYSADFRRTVAHHSNLYYGASIAAFDYLLASQGYALVGGNSAGNNAFFVRQDLLNERVQAVSISFAYRETSFSETRDTDGKLTFIRGRDRRAIIADLPLIDVKSGDELRVADLPST